MTKTSALFQGLCLAAGLGLCPAAALAAEIPANSPAIHYEGRWQEEADGSRAAAQGAVYIKAAFTGTKVSVKLRDGNNRWLVTIDGQPAKKITAAKAGQPTLLAENLPAGSHALRLERATEGLYGISHFDGLITDSADLTDSAGSNSSPAVKAASAKSAPSIRSQNSRLSTTKKLRLEFVGDSITAGFRNDGQKRGRNDADIEDGSMSFAPQLAQRLGADYSVLAKSGEGVVHNWGAAWPDKGLHTEERYRWTFFGGAKVKGNTLWQSEKRPVDAVIIAMGTNDFSDKKRRPYHNEYVKAYLSLIRTVHAMNPQASILCLEPLPAMITPVAGLWIEEACRTAAAEGLPVSYLPLNSHGPLLAPEDFVGDGTHPTKAGSAKLADFLLSHVVNLPSVQACHPCFRLHQVRQDY